MEKYNYSNTSANNTTRTHAFKYALYVKGEQEPFMAADDIDYLVAIADIRTGQPLDINDPYCDPDTVTLESTPALVIIDEHTHAVLREWDSVTPIEELELSVRAYNCLNRAHIRTVEQLRAMSFDDIASIRNLGTRSTAEILCRLYNVTVKNARATMYYKFSS